MQELILTPILQILSRYGAEPYLTTLAPWLMGVAALFGLLNCFMGYEYRNVWYMLLCVFGGMAVGAFFSIHYEWDPGICIFIALAAAIVFAFFYRIGLSLVMLCFGCYLCSALLGFSGWITLLPGLGLAAAALFRDRWTATVVTALAGACIAVNSVCSLVPFLSGLSAQDPIHTVLTALSSGAVYYAAVAILSIAGFLVQAHPWGRKPLFRFPSSKKETM